MPTGALTLKHKVAEGNIKGSEKIAAKFSLA